MLRSLKALDIVKKIEPDSVRLGGFHMQRVQALIVSLSIVTGSAIAGQIQIGGVNGLTSSYITGGCSTNVAGQTCISGSTGAFVEQNYDARLFTGATLGGAAPTPYTGYSTCLLYTSDAADE